MSNWTGSRFTNTYTWGGRQCLTGQALASQTHTLGGGGEAMSNWTGSRFTNTYTWGGEAMSNWTGSRFTNTYTWGGGGNV